MGGQQGGASATPAAVAPVAPGIDLTGLLLEVVSDKTGYPADMLTLEMELESDLGIDSIKRVEILSGMREKAPSLPEVDASEMAELQTLGQIVEYMGGQQGGAAATPTTVAAEPTAVVMPANLGRFVLDTVVAEPAGFMVRGLDRGLVAVTRDGLGVAEALVSRLAAAGFDARIVDTVPADAASVVFLGGLAEVDAQGARAVNKAAFAAASIVAKRLSEEGGAFVTVQDTGGDFGLTDPGDRAWLCLLYTSDAADE